jgi:hypothetical protein
LREQIIAGKPLENVFGEFQIHELILTRDSATGNHISCAAQGRRRGLAKGRDPRHGCAHLIWTVTRGSCRRVRPIIGLPIRQGHGVHRRSQIGVSKRVDHRFSAADDCEDEDLNIFDVRDFPTTISGFGC